MLKKILKKEKTDIYYLIEKFEKVRFPIIQTSLFNIVLQIYENYSRGIDLRNILVRKLKCRPIYIYIYIIMPINNEMYAVTKDG